MLVVTCSMHVFLVQITYSSHPKSFQSYGYLIGLFAELNIFYLFIYKKEISKTLFLGSSRLMLMQKKIFKNTQRENVNEIEIYSNWSMWKCATHVHIKLVNIGAKWIPTHYTVHTIHYFTCNTQANTKARRKPNKTKQKKIEKKNFVR